jgi:putative GTP pyrophosphokinase
VEFNSIDKNNSDAQSQRTLYLKAIELFQRHGGEIEQIRQLLDIRLNQLALAYTTENRLPSESIVVKTRVKTFAGFLKKMETLKLTDFDYPSNIIYDLIGARVICWFLDDCTGFANCIKNSNFIAVDHDSVFDYVAQPTASGYRGIHLHAKISFERVATSHCHIKLAPHKILCEIQVRTKLMDAWADLTHEFHYKAKGLGLEDHGMEKVLEAQSKRFQSEDESFIAIRDLYQKMITNTNSK